jgi:hypothetical protein
MPCTRRTRISLSTNCACATGPWICFRLKARSRVSPPTSLQRCRRTDSRNNNPVVVEFAEGQVGAKEGNPIKIEGINLDEKEMFEAIFVKRDGPPPTDLHDRAITAMEVSIFRRMLKMNALLT